MATITWLDKIDGLDLNDPQKNVNAADMNQIKSVTNTNATDLDTAEATLASHVANVSNPHSVTKTQVGLSNVDNTSDADKPVSTAQATAIGVVQTDINTHEALTNNPHSVTKTQVGLSNVDNTSDTNKPVSTAQQAALDLKLPLTLTANTNVTGDFNLNLGTSANHLNALSVFTETQLFFHAQDDLTINVHEAVGADVVGISITPNQVAIAAGFANSTTLYLRDENSSTAFEIDADNGNIVLIAAAGFNINLTADNINISGNVPNIALTGVPTAPTAAAATDTTQVATTAFVHDAIGNDEVWGEVPSGAVDGVNDDFTIANSNPSKVALYLDGIRTNPSNFSITGTALMITNAGVIPTNSILIDYIK